MKCAKCGRQQRAAGRQAKNYRLCSACFALKLGGENVQKMRVGIEAGRAKPSGNVKRKRGKARKNEVAAMLSGVSLGGNAKRARGKGKAKHVTYTMLAGLPPTSQTYGVVMKERSQR